MSSDHRSRRTARALLQDHGTTFADQAGITLRNRPSPLFRLLVLTALLSANIDARLGLRTSRALTQAGYTTARHLADADDSARWQVLADSKYLRKKQTARQLGQLADEVLDRYAGDLRRLPTGDADALRDELRQFTGVGPLGADIFCREVQAVWPDLRPFADDRMLELAGRHDLPTEAKALARAVGTTDLSRLGAALVSAEHSR